MPYIQFSDKQFPLTASELSIGAFEGAAVRLQAMIRGRTR